MADFRVDLVEWSAFSKTPFWSTHMLPHIGNQVRLLYAQLATPGKKPEEYDVVRGGIVQLNHLAAIVQGSTTRAERADRDDAIAAAQNAPTDWTDPVDQPSRSPLSSRDPETA